MVCLLATDPDLNQFFLPEPDPEPNPQHCVIVQKHVLWCVLYKVINVDKAVNVTLFTNQGPLFLNLGQLLDKYLLF